MGCQRVESTQMPMCIGIERPTCKLRHIGINHAHDGLKHAGAAGDSEVLLGYLS